MIQILLKLRQITIKQWIILLLGTGLFGLLIYAYIYSLQGVQKPSTLWKIESIDTMKSSRDLAREKSNSPSFDEEIEYQIQSIKEMGASHVAIGTPYDEEFIPYMKRWITMARKYRLKVWFRGNFSGWEQWFEYKKITPEEHKHLLENFIHNNPDLFETGDIFSPCTECENGSKGDPRQTGRISEYRQFIISEYNLSTKAFKDINKDVLITFPMNGDVAEKVMDKETTTAMGGIIVVDHYVKTPEQLAEDIKRYASTSGGQVILGETGVYIPNIHGTMTESEQAVWMEDALTQLSQDENLIGINYWVFSDGTTELWNNKTRTKKKIAEVLQSFYKPE